MHKDVGKCRRFRFAKVTHNHDAFEKMKKNEKRRTPQVPERRGARGKRQKAESGQRALITGQIIPHADVGNASELLP